MLDALEEHLANLPCRACTGRRVRESGQLIELDPTSLQPVAALSLDLTDLQMAYGPGALWAVGGDSEGIGHLVEIAPAP